MKLIDISNKRFGRLTVCSIGYRKKTSGAKRIYWECACDCGGKTYALKSDLAGGKKLSCGCLIAAGTWHRHDMCYTKFYRVWASIKDRCYNKNLKSYKNYGGRGISVCDKWHDFVNFKNDMYESYLIHKKTNKKNNTTIDRINNNCGYNKENCKWSTHKEQSQNKRSRKLNTVINKNNTSGFVGVTKSGENWRARIRVNQKEVFIGAYKDKVEAAKAYNVAALKYHGEFACINEGIQ